jgi:hypothetical protein
MSTVPSGELSQSDSPKGRSRRAGLSSLIANGWAWSIGWNPNYGGWYAQAWRYLPRAIRVDGRLKLKECFIEGGKNMEDALLKLLERVPK